MRIEVELDPDLTEVYGKSQIGSLTVKENVSLNRPVVSRRRRYLRTWALNYGFLYCKKCSRRHQVKTFKEANTPGRAETING
jgi:hypothetical protein